MGTPVGAEHPEPQFVLAITVWSGTLYALCFTAGGRPDAAWDGANSGELHAAHPDDRGVGGGGGDEGVVEPGTPLSPMSVPNDSSCLEVFALDLETCVWRKVQVEVRTACTTCAHAMQLACFALSHCSVLV